MTSPPAGRCYLDRVPNLLAPGSKLAGNQTRCCWVPTPRLWHQDHLQRRLRHNLSLRHRHQLPNRWDTGARKGNLVADFAAKPGPPQKFPLPGFKESDDSAEVILEPRLIAVEYIFNYYFYYIDALASLDFKVVSKWVIDVFRISNKSNNTSDTKIIKIIK